MATRIPLSLAEERHLFEAIAAWPLRNRVLIHVGLRTGFRAHELSSLTVGHVFDGAEIRPELTVSRQHLKGGRGLRRKAVRSRTVPLAESTRTLLREFLASRTDLCGPPSPAAALFASRKGRGSAGISPWTINRLVKSACAAAGLTSARYGSHTLRKSFARRVYRASGNDLVLTQASLGHTDIRVTQRYLLAEEDAVKVAILAAGTAA